MENSPGRGRAGPRGRSNIADVLALAQQNDIEMLGPIPDRSAGRQAHASTADPLGRAIRPAAAPACGVG